jgi:hypothetical protein
MPGSSFRACVESKSAARTRVERRSRDAPVNFAHFLLFTVRVGDYETVTRFTHMRTCIRIRKPTHRFPPLLRFCSHAVMSKTGIPKAPVPRGLQRQQILATRDPFLSLVCAYQ